MNSIALIKVLMPAVFLFTSTIGMADTKDERALFAYLKVQPSKEKQFLDATQSVIEESRKEPGCLIYILHESEKNSQQFLFYELFKSDAALQAHRKSKHVVEFLNKVNPILIPGQFVLDEYDVK